MAQLTEQQKAKRDEYMAAKLRYLGYKVNPPAQPQRQTQSLSESYYGDDDYNKPNGWLPQAMQDRTGRSWKALADRRVPWANVCKNGETPEEILAAGCSMLAMSIMSPRDLAMINPNTEL